MSFLSPISAVLAGAVALPLLLLLYFLKLRRRYQRVSSTLLWRNAFTDLEVNAPFQRIRGSLLLLLQLLLLALLLLSLAQPVVGGQERVASRVIIIIDRSASMSTTDASANRTRLDAAKDAARGLVDRMGRGAGATQVMVIAYGRHATMVSPFTFDRSSIIRAIESIEPSDEEAHLDAALHLAAGFAGDTEDAGAQSGDVVLISDGVVAPPRDPIGYRLRFGRFRMIYVGPQTDVPVNNLGIVSLSARRDYDDPARVQVFTRLLNAGESAISTVLTLRLNDRVEEIRQVLVPPATANAPGETTASFPLLLEGGGVLQLSHNHRDSLATDDVAWLVIPPPQRLRIAIVHDGASGGADPFTQDLLTMLEPQSLIALTREAFERIDDRDVDTGMAFDLIVFDRVSGHRLPGVPSITFGGVPRGITSTETTREGGRRILSWDRQHPIMRHVSLDPVVYAGFSGYVLPPAATTLASGPDGAVIALVGTRNARHVLVGFDLPRSNWPLHVSIAVFLQNAVEHLTMTASGDAGLAFQPGQAIQARTQPTATALTIDGPMSISTPTEPGVVRTLPLLSRAGLYTIQGVTSPMDRLALNVMSDVQSDLRPKPQLLVNSESVAGRDAASVVPRELWPWLLGAVVVLLAIEWLTYCRKISR
ncbi:MAG TPA: VWA domain-containing protein [Phycisphaerales bacterium]|nr:VWA domain-containing protein [Phycisphaerales bacterium]HRQ74659.1 VWA domain-containing protein [Phycisphaerales bacterium]